MKRIFLAAFLISLFLLSGCSDSDQYLYDNDDAIALQIHAEMVVSYEIDSAHVRADTVSSRDTMIFIGEINPDRQAHYREYYWTLDGKDFSSDMNFMKSVTKAGHHEICFVVIDFYGDTLRDTLQLLVTNPPIVEPQGFIPAIGSQGLSPKEGITFAWHGFDPDSISKVYYRFEIREPKGLAYTYDIHQRLYTSSNSILDTLVDVQGNFFTKGNRNEGGIQAFIRFSNESLYDSYSRNGKIHLDILDSLSNPVVEREMGLDTNQVVVSPLKPGKYRIIASLPKLTDFSPDTAEVVILPGEIAIADTLPLVKFYVIDTLEAKK